VLLGQRFSPCGTSLGGMISYLTRRFGGNVHDKGLIAVTGSGATGSPENTVDLQGRSSHFQSRDEPNSWICYDFKGMEITPMHYSILSFPSGRELSSEVLVLRSIGDGQSWGEVHRCENNSDVNGSSRVGTHSVGR
jgi:hypothetical protein